jgi:hypothetical protein
MRSESPASELSVLERAGNAVSSDREILINYKLMTRTNRASVARPPAQIHISETFTLASF